MAYPSGTPSYAGFTSSHTLSADNHAAQHNQEQADITALANKVGTGASTPVNQRLLRGNGTGTSAWAQADLTSDVSNVLPVANGGTGQNSLTALPLTSPAITGAVSGGATYSSPTLTTPVIGDFTNAAHTHASNAQGGQLTGSAIATGSQLADRLKNPYKFSVYLTSSATINSDPYTVLFDTKEFDTSSNVDIVTNKGRFTAPIAGFYLFLSVVNVNVAVSSAWLVSLYKNGSRAKYFSEVVIGNSTFNEMMGGTAFLSLAANDYIEIKVENVNGRTLNGGTADVTWFSGFLVSAT